MKKINVFLVSGLALMAVIVFSAFANRGPVSEKMSCAASTVVEEIQGQQTINMFVTHGHCSSPFSGKVENLEVNTKIRTDGGDPLEDMQVSFQINPETFTTCRREYSEITSSVQTPGLFSDEEHGKIMFKSTSVYTMGIDWYQINGKLSIKGVEKEVKFFASGIRDPRSPVASKLVLEGQLDLTDWGIDYDLITTGKSNEHPTKWMHLNIRIDLPVGCWLE